MFYHSHYFAEALPEKLVALNAVAFPSTQILDVWFGRTVIRSCAKLSYEDAMALLKTPYDKLADLESHVHVREPFTLSNVKRSVTYLDMVSSQCSQ